jgi:threonylcarbamoyladenosine tRNA methylthiotransferase MtaB
VRSRVDKLNNVEGYHVENFGCRASRSDGEAIAAGLRGRGLSPASTLDSAHVVVLNTCSVTAEADRSARAFIRRVRRRNPQARIVVTGCYAQRAPEEIAALEGVDAVIGNSHKGGLAVLAAALGAVPDSGFDGRSRWSRSGDCSTGSSDMVPVTAITQRGVPIYVDPTFAHAELATLPFAADSHQTRPNLKVQDGCNNRCSFCIIPATRGPSRSVPLKDCLDNVRRFVDGGGQELVLSGINLGHWGRDFAPKERFVDLVTAILLETSLPRLRLSSIEPMDWSAELLELFCNYAAGARPRLAPHAHLPLQSGSDTILRKMFRRYRPWHYAERTEMIRAALPDAAIGADVMVGFPGETDALFEESYRFIAAQPFTYLHLFPFSARPGTPGWEFYREHPVPPAAVAYRMDALRGLADEKARTFRKQFAGRRLSVVTLEGGDVRQTPGLSANFLKVEIAGALPSNQMVEARVFPGADDSILTGQIIHETQP